MLTVIVGIALTYLVVPSIFFENGPTNAEGAYTAKFVYGTVYDQTGQPLDGASVAVEIWGGYWPDQDYFRISASAATDASGYYEVSIDANYWDPHNTIVVIATQGMTQGTQKAEADAEPTQYVDVHTGTVIPEFSGSLGLLAVAGFVIPALVLRVRLPKSGARLPRSVSRS